MTCQEIVAEVNSVRKVQCYTEEKDVPGHIPSEVQTGLESEVELHKNAAHKTRPRRGSLNHVRFDRWRAGNVCNTTLVAREETSW